MSAEKTHLEICNLTKEQYPQIKTLMDQAYPDFRWRVAKPYYF